MQLSIYAGIKALSTFPSVLLVLGNLSFCIRHKHLNCSCIILVASSTIEKRTRICQENFHRRKKAVVSIILLFLFALLSSLAPWCLLMTEHRLISFNILIINSSQVSHYVQGFSSSRCQYLFQKKMQRIYLTRWLT